MLQDNTHGAITRLQKTWTIQAILANALVAIAITSFIAVLFHLVFSFSFWWMLVFLPLSVLLVFNLNRSWKIGLPDVTTFLNRQIPQLEESAGLVLRPVQSLNFLEKLQLQKIDKTLHSIEAPNPVKKRMYMALFSLLAVLAICLLVMNLALPIGASNNVSNPLATSKKTVPEKHLPEISKAVITVTPPPYTQRSQRRQPRFNVVVEENSTVHWELNMNEPVDKVQLIFNDKTVLPLQPAGASRTKWSLQKVINQPGFYQVKIGAKLSEMYLVEVIKDKVPVISVRSPKSGTIIENGQAQQVTINALLTDDYAIKEAHITATIASGSGEGVSFKEQQLRLNNFVSGSPRQQFQQTLSLPSLGMRPGDELYLYLQATDSHNQQTRSDVFIVSLQDTAQLMSIDGLVNGLDLKPEFFRSQRQIIIETEQLLKSRDTMTVEAFNTKSNDLGVDQKLLRLRYGKFLGEESSTEIGDGHDEHGDDHGQSKTFGNANEIMDQFAHKHDIAEDATFFDPETKTQLKATLAEMWNAEGKLRILKPAEALPFEYKALRLLKDLQQKSRVYVAKTSFTSSPLKPLEKRLTGELDKIGQPVNKRETVPANDGTDLLRNALGVLELIRNRPISAPALTTLQQATQKLTERAATNPRQYLPALQSLKKILNKRHSPQDISTVQKALQSIIQTPQSLPYQQSKLPSSLSENYFKNLKSGSR